MYSCRLQSRHEDVNIVGLVRDNAEPDFFARVLDRVNSDLEVRSSPKVQTNPKHYLQILCSVVVSYGIGYIYGGKGRFAGCLAKER